MEAPLKEFLKMIMIFDRFSLPGYSGGSHKDTERGGLNSRPWLNSLNPKRKSFWDHEWQQKRYRFCFLQKDKIRIKTFISHCSQIHNFIYLAAATIGR